MYLEVDLVNNPRSRRHHAEVFKRRLPPAQKLVALAVALELDGGVGCQRQRAVVLIDLHRVVDDQVDRHLRVNELGVAA